MFNFTGQDCCIQLTHVPKLQLLRSKKLYLLNERVFETFTVHSLSNITTFITTAIVLSHKERAH